MNKKELKQFLSNKDFTEAEKYLKSIAKPIGEDSSGGDIFDGPLYFYAINDTLIIIGVYCSDYNWGAQKELNGLVRMVKFDKLENLPNYETSDFMPYNENGGLYESKAKKNMKKNIVKINENTFRKIIAESVRKALNEIINPFDDGFGGVDTAMAASYPNRRIGDAWLEKAGMRRDMLQGGKLVPINKGEENESKKSAKINESQLMQIVAESVKKVLKEDSEDDTMQALEGFWSKVTNFQQIAYAIRTDDGIKYLMDAFPEECESIKKLIPSFATGEPIFAAGQVVDILNSMRRKLRSNN